MVLSGRIKTGLGVFVEARRSPPPTTVPPVLRGVQGTAGVRAGPRGGGRAPVLCRLFLPGAHATLTRGPRGSDAEGLQGGRRRPASNPPRPVLRGFVSRFGCSLCDSDLVRVQLLRVSSDVTG